MAKTFYVSPGRSYTVTASEGTTITYPGIATPAATVGSVGSVTFNCTGTEIVVSDNSAKIVQNFNNAGAAVAGAGGGSGSTEGVALLEGGNSFNGDQTITGDVTIDGAVTISGDVTAEGEYNGAEVIETQDTTIIPEAGKYYKYTGTGDTITVTAPVWNGYMTISYLETAEPIDLQGVTWSPAKPSLTGVGPFVYTLVCAESGSILASVMNYSVATAEAIQKIVPMAWDGEGKAFVDKGTYGLAVGINASASSTATAFGNGAEALSRAIALGNNAKTSNGTYYEVAIGNGARAKNHCSLILGSALAEIVDGQFVEHFATTEGTGSITIGAGANTLNNGDTESSNSVTIGCKASNTGADSVVIGASSSTVGAGSIVIGTAAKTTDNQAIAVGAKATAKTNATAIGYYANADFHSISIGHYAAAKSVGGVSIGNNSVANKHSLSVGSSAKSNANNSIAIGTNAAVSDYGATVIRSTAEDGTYTQLYFSGANTPLANTYENGEAMMGYVVRDSAGNVMTDAEGNAMVGTQKLSVLFPNNRGENAFTPAMLGLDDEWTPKPMFRPSDLDMPQEEPTEPEEYQPLPVYPIVEPEIPSESSEEL